MNKKKITLIISLLTVILIGIYILTNNTNTEKYIALCVNEILNKAEISSIQIETKNRGKSPILKGVTSKKKKDLVLKLLDSQCGVVEFQDFIEVKTKIEKVEAWLNFKIDNVNNIITVSGQVGSQTELHEILNSFATNDKSITHSLSINKQIPTIDFAIDVTLIMASIENIKLADISISSSEIILKGLVRDQIRENETISKLERIFFAEKTINNQLELVVKHTKNIEGLKFDFTPVPTLERPDKGSDT
ncbi:MAG: hypothetical protein JKX98_02840 [Alcanivoracaceae bacterium]|nr:hypothetical protein [Alcanivoracaceae bacterium]